MFLYRVGAEQIRAKSPWRPHPPRADKTEKCPQNTLKSVKGSQMVFLTGKNCGAMTAYKIT